MNNFKCYFFFLFILVVEHSVCAAEVDKLQKLIELNIVEDTNKIAETISSYEEKVNIFLKSKETALFSQKYSLLLTMTRFFNFIYYYSHDACYELFDLTFAHPGLHIPEFESFLFDAIRLECNDISSLKNQSQIFNIGIKAIESLPNNVHKKAVCKGVTEWAIFNFLISKTNFTDFLELIFKESLDPALSYRKNKDKISQKKLVQFYYRHFDDLEPTTKRFVEPWLRQIFPMHITFQSPYEEKLEFAFNDWVTFYQNHKELSAYIQEITWEGPASIVKLNETPYQVLSFVVQIDKLKNISRRLIGLDTNALNVFQNAIMIKLDKH